MRAVYADHAATTRVAPEVLEAMAPFLGEGFGNASSVHRRGEAAREAIEGARVQVADLIGATPEEIVFTASGSESNNLAVQGVLSAASGERRRLVISAIEHPSVLETARYLESRGVPLTVVPVDERGVVLTEGLVAAMGADVALVSIMWANNEVGTLQAIEDLAALARAAGARFHTDAVQAAGKLPIDVDAAGVDLLTIAGHKLRGPLGAAALYVRRRTRVTPLVHGGHQERSRRAGTENLPAIVGLGAAATLAKRALEAGEPARVGGLADRLLVGLLERVPGARLNGPREPRAPGIVNVRFTGVDGEAVLHALDEQGVTVSTGSACSAASPGPSHVLIAMGLGPEDAHASVRFSLGADNTEADLQHILAVTPPVIERLRALADSPARRTA